MELLQCMKLKFPYGVSILPNFGTISTIYLWLAVESPNEVIPFSFLFDTGAEITSFPVSAAEKLGIDLDNCPQEPMTGYEGTTILAYRSEIRLYLNNQFLQIPCVFNPNEEVPILLGRAGILNKFNIFLDGKNKQITFEEI